MSTEGKESGATSADGPYVHNPEIREGNKDVGVLQAPRQYVADIRLSFDTIAARHQPINARNQR